MIAPLVNGIIREYANSMAQKTTQSDWEDRAKRYIKAQLKHADMTYEELAKRMKPHGFEETKVSVSNKLSRGTFAASWFLASLAALELEGVRLEDL
jgi:hypothetical protein